MRETGGSLDIEVIPQGNAGDDRSKFDFSLVSEIKTYNHLFYLFIQQPLAIIG